MLSIETMLAICRQFSGPDVGVSLKYNINLSQGTITCTHKISTEYKKIPEKSPPILEAAKAEARKILLEMTNFKVYKFRQVNFSHYLFHSRHFSVYCLESSFIWPCYITWFLFPFHSFSFFSLASYISTLTLY